MNRHKYEYLGILIYSNDRFHDLVINSMIKDKSDYLLSIDILIDNHIKYELI